MSALPTPNPASNPRPARGQAFAVVLLAFLGGVAIQLQQAQLLDVWMSLGLLILALLSLLLVWHRPTGLGRSLGLVLATAVIGFASTDWRAQHFHANRLNPQLEGRDLEVVGLVAAMPQRNENGVRFRFAVEQSRLEGRDVKLPALLDLGWYGAYWRSSDGLIEPSSAVAALRAGERWRLLVRLKAPHGGRNPHGFDYELWLWEQGVQANGYVRAGPRDPVPQRLDSTWHYPIDQLRQSVRDQILKRLSASDDPIIEREQMAARQRRAGVVAALVTGDQRVIDRADWDVFRATGVAHLMSISGLHITMFAWLASALIGWCWRRSSRMCLAWPAPHAAMVAGLVLAFAYALFSGWGVPAQRTVLMLATATVLRLSARQWPWWLMCLLAASVVTAADPWALLQPGFWLSFVAVSVLFLTDRRTPSAKRSAPWAGLLHLLREQGVLTLALAPMTLLLFGQVSLAGFFANLLAIPWVTLVVTPLSMLGVLWAPLWDLAAWAVQGLSQFLGLLASLPAASLSLPQAPLWAGAAGLMGGLMLAMRLPWSLRLLGLPLLLPLLLWSAPRPGPGQFDLLAADIGQGNAVLLLTANHALLYDAGPRYSLESDAGHRVLLPLLRALSVRLDMVVLSHRDSDHTGGAAAVFNMQPQVHLLSSLEDAHPLRQRDQAGRCEAGQRWVWDGVQFEVLHPSPEDYDDARRSNALSCVLRIQGEGGSALLTGDIEQAQESRLVDSGQMLKADLLLVPHHGSKTSSSPSFLEAVSPNLALVQAGYRNRFGHPAPTVMARYREQGVAVFDSVRCGAAHWQSSLPAQVRCQRDLVKRYWQHVP
ncbi:MAG: DNA internalization-related competence protein ComEC/Rec2 [Hylemonella sp.]